ncbi:MAG TPA: glycosyltransferase family 9 protein [Sedimentisphaerales bacterium]|nr:glycosyltransferase family 9 protein [Sedimentisphaerales bacterium]
MEANEDILQLLREKAAEVARKAHCGVILQPGAIGDCILTLPLVAFMKDALGLSRVDILGHTEYTGILPGRTCADGVRSMESLELHRLFADANTFDLADHDPLINAFAEYAWIVTFLGEPNSDFEQNLIFTANCSHSAEVITISLKPPEKSSMHITDHYIQQFISQSGLALESARNEHEVALIRATDADAERGRELLEEIDLDFSKKIMVIQPGSGGVHKSWHLDNYLALAGELGRRNMDVIFLLGPAERDRFSDPTIEQISSAGKCLTDLSLTHVLGLLSCTDVFVGNDSGITHLAAGLGVRTLAVFGPTNPVVYRPVGPAVSIFANCTQAFSEKPSAELQQKILEVLLT